MTEQKEPEEQGSSQQEQASQPEVEEFGTLEEQLDEALREKDQFRSLAERARADLYNYRRSADQEIDSLRQRANERLLLSVLSIVDDFNLALVHVPENASDAALHQGLQLIQRKIQTLLDSEGVHKMEADGQPFDPREHEAVLYQETEGGQEGIVTNVFRDGYTLHQRVLRAAQVVVSKSPEQQDESETTNQEAQ